MKNTVKKQTKVPANTWSEAIAAVNNGVPIRTATKTYGVSHEPLQQQLRGVVPLQTCSRPKLVYVSENHGGHKLVERFHYRSLSGMLISFGELRGMLRQVAEETEIHPLTDVFP
ncbi:hypothetical protein L917_13281 [Phytophthora nicotianae]|uniref:HTH psq-type domain-containing protein n=2 Tax=Phytophthora nicotianae TaxID=4792 RepID=W2IJL7_PHYNI|nr:hypothetical protein L915_13572 [Phytophthora nicotianae]ETL34285.1 hypothetical protein L916_13473 [Phytophthora nicotianae]ETL87562.1 hypothetical protein L917_13281 [Phytophthora nicotianae]